MATIRLVIQYIIDILNMNLNVLGYSISLMSIILFVVLGGILLNFLITFFD